MVIDPKQPTLFVDTSTIRAFLRLQRLDILAGTRVVDHIQNDIRMISSPEHRAIFDQALDKKILHAYAVTDLRDMRTANDLYDKYGLGRGEAFSCVAVLREKAMFVIAALDTIERLNTCFPQVPILTIPEFFRRCQKEGILSRQEATVISRKLVM